MPFKKNKKKRTQETHVIFKFDAIEFDCRAGRRNVAKRLD